MIILWPALFVSLKRIGCETQKYRQAAGRHRKVKLGIKNSIFDLGYIIMKNKSSFNFSKSVMNKVL